MKTCAFTLQNMNGNEPKSVMSTKEQNEQLHKKPHWNQNNQCNMENQGPISKPNPSLCLASICRRGTCKLLVHTVCNISLVSKTLIVLYWILRKILWKQYGSWDATISFPLLSFNHLSLYQWTLSSCFSHYFYIFIYFGSIFYCHWSRLPPFHFFKLFLYISLKVTHLLARVAG